LVESVLVAGGFVVVASLAFLNGDRFAFREIALCATRKLYPW
jgi:hypothetical protein